MANVSTLQSSLDELSTLREEEWQAIRELESILPGVTTKLRSLQALSDRINQKAEQVHKLILETTRPASRRMTILRSRSGLSSIIAVG